MGDTQKNRIFSLGVGPNPTPDYTYATEDLDKEPYGIESCIFKAVSIY